MYKNSTTTKVVIPFIGKGIGDCIVISGLIDTLTKYGYKVTIVADSKTSFLFQHWDGIENLFTYAPESEDETIEKLKHIGPFIFIDPHEITQSSIHTFNLIRRSKPVRTIGFNENFSVYDKVLGMTQPLGHISSKCVDLIEHLGIQEPSYQYVVHIPEKNKKEASKLIKSINNKKIITFIPYGSVRTRFFSDEQINTILSYFAQYADEVHVLIIGEQDKIKGIRVGGNASKNPFPSFFTAAQLIKESHLVISPDTSIVHLSRCFEKRMVCFYPFKIVNNGADNADVWGPNYDKALQIRLPEEYLMDADINLLIDSIRLETDKIRDMAY